MISLTGPELSPEQRARLTKHKEQLEKRIHKTEAHSDKVAELREKETELRKDAKNAERGAANFQPDDELRLIAAMRGIDRVRYAIEDANAQCHDDKLALFKSMDESQEIVAKICQATYEKFLDDLGANLASAYDTFHNARYAARSVPAVGVFVREVLTHSSSPNNSLELVVSAAKSVLKKIDDLLSGDELWSYEGAEAPAKK